MLLNFEKKMKLKQGDIMTRVKGTLQPQCAKANKMSTQGTHFLYQKVYDEHGKVLKLATVQDYYRHVGYVSKPHQMTNSYFTSRWS